MNTLTFNKSTDLYNMILGGLIALSSEQQVGKLARKPSSENIFLGKWLKRVKKQRCYPKNVSSDIDNLLHLYSVEGRTGDLASLFRQIFLEFQLLKGMPQQFVKTEKQRFDNAMSDLANDDWLISLPIKHCKNAFNEQNILTKSFSIFVVSAPQEVVDCLYEHGFLLVQGLTSQNNEGNDYYQYQLFPSNNCYGDITIPSKFQS